MPRREMVACLSLQTDDDVCRENECRPCQRFELAMVRVATDPLVRLATLSPRLSFSIINYKYIDRARLFCLVIIQGPHGYTKIICSIFEKKIILITYQIIFVKPGHYFWIIIFYLFYLRTNTHRNVGVEITDITVSTSW